MTVVWLPRAIQQLLGVIDFISEDNPQAAIELAQTIRTKGGALSAHLNRYRTGRIAGTREMVVEPNYIVVYRVMPDEVQVLRVRHARRLDH
ncbi:type II toxin-antitoxin system RelE/ParE family toxin [Paraburkholderia sp.]|uniref:type II toxin-antitoxin system RelE/ParE family toxin n=1 Tax=Paraburkholderia sp. TaxID=1926495 RepID=UPI002396F47C|nr:type II toxin-antitoxin system RelE/ParE family toxin [Paraburkholderia sp.]MDE1183788.1 type II toxin-antitoxin system RelE/ParE family toxin [Paraburkholderia sp.]